MKSMKSLMSLAVLAAGVLAAGAANAAKSAKAIEYSDGRMIYYYDDADHSSDAKFVKQWAVRTTSGGKSPTTVITTIVIDSSFVDWKYGYMEGYFWGLSDATTILGLEYLNTSSATTIASMFRGCSKLTTLDLSHLDTAKVTTMAYMFMGCSSLASVDLSSFVNAKLTSIQSMFQGCSALTTIYATENFDCSGVKTGTSAFYSCSENLTGDRGTAWNAQNVSGTYARLDGGTDAPGYFSRPRCTLTVDSSDFSTKHIQSVSVLTNSVPVEPIGGTSYSLEHGVPATIVYTPASGYWFDGAATYTDERYATAGLTADATLSGDDIPTATAITSDLTLTVDKTAFAVSNIQAVVMRKAVDGSVVAPSSETAEANTYTVKSGIGFTLTYQATDGNYFLVEETGNGRILDSFSANSTYAETGIAADTMVTTCPNAEETISGTAIRGVVSPTDPGTLSFYCDDTARVGTVYLRKASTGYPTWNGLAAVTNVVIDQTLSEYGSDGDGFQYFFCNLSNVTAIAGLHNLDTSHAKTLYQMFKGCSSLRDLDLSSWTSPAVTSMADMFYGCSSLTNLDISSFSTNGLTGCGNTFRACPELRTIFARSAFDISSVSGTWVFWSSTKIVGGNGTSSKDFERNAPTYGRVDTAATPGYFTQKTQTLTIDVAGKRIASVVVTCRGEAVTPVEGVYTVPKGEGVTITYTAADGYVFTTSATFVDTTYAESGFGSNVALTGDAVPSGVVARTMTVATSDFATRHIDSVALRAADGTTAEPTSANPNVYTIGEGVAFDLVFTSANGWCFENVGRHQTFAYADGISADTSFDMTRVAQTVAVQDSYRISYYDGKDNHIALRDTTYPYSETEAFALDDASSMAPVPTSASYGRFLGWCETADRSDTPVKALPALTLGDKKLYAAYEYGTTDWLFNQVKERSVATNWTGTVVAHASSDKVTAGASYAVTMPYRLILPESFEPGRKYPLILHLHGAGSRGNNNATQLSAGLKYAVDYMRRRGVEAVVVAPQVPLANNAFGPDGYTAWDFVSEQMRADVPGATPVQQFGPTWVDTQWNLKTNHTMADVPTVWFQAATNILFATIADSALQIDTDRIYVMGMSMGGYGTWEMLSRFPTLFAAAVPCCGGVDTNQVAAFRETAVWAFHGTKDSTVWPVRSQEAVAALQAAGGAPRYREYGADYGLGEGICSSHNCWSVTFADDNVMDWFFAQDRSATVTMVSWTGAGDGTSWADASNWSPRAPAAGDRVVVDNAANVTLAAATPRYLSVAVGTSGAAKLTMSGADAALVADEITVGAYATVTCADSSSRVSLKGYSVTVAEGGTVEANGKGAATATATAAGGAIAFELTGPLTVGGTISTKGAAAVADLGTSAGAGGAIAIEAGEIVPAGGTVAAEGGDATEPYAESTTGRIGAGGAITLAYQTHIQSEFTANKAFDLTVSAEHGTYRWTEDAKEKTLSCVELDKYGTEAQLGTIWMADNKLMGGFGRGLNGELLNVTDYQNIAGQSYSPFKGGHARLVGSSAMTLLNLNVAAGARLELGGGEATNFAGVIRQRGDALPAFNPFRSYNNSIVIAAGGRLDVYAPKTEAAADAAVLGTTGTTFTVNGELRLWSDPVTGVAPKICAKSFIANAGSVVSAANAGKWNGSSSDGGTIRISSNSYDQKAGSLFTVTGGNGLIDIWSWKPVEDGERLVTRPSPQPRRGQNFEGTLELGENGRQNFSFYGSAIGGAALILR